jgi:CRP/FNR family transcriptional regulator, cyclic AMP receptor protein
MPLGNLNFQLLANQGCSPQGFGPGEEIFVEGDEGDRMYVIRTGEVEIFRGGKLITTLTSGDIFGEMALIDGSPRLTTARAKGTCEVAPITKRAFMFLVHETPVVALSVMRTLADRVRRMNRLT